MITLPLALSIILTIIVVYLINKNISFTTKIYLLEKELEKYKQSNNTNLEYKKREKEFKSQSILSKNRILKLRENDFSQN